MQTPAERRQGGEVSKFQLPIVSSVQVAGYGGLAEMLWRSSTHPGDLLGLGGFVAAYLATRAGTRLIRDIDYVRRDRAARKTIEDIANLEAGAKFATWDNLRASEDITQNTGLFCGVFEDGKGRRKKVFNNGEDHAAIIAPPKSLKSMAILAPTLLENLGTNAIVNDPSGELCALVRPWLLSRGWDCPIIAPAPEKISKLLGYEIEDWGIDVASGLRPDMLLGDLLDELAAMAKWIVPGQVHMENNTKFFVKDAENLITFFSMWLLKHGEPVTLPGLRRAMMVGVEELHELLDEAAESDAFNGSLRESANAIGSTMGLAGPQFAAGYGTLQQSLAPYVPGSNMGDHTSGSVLDPRVLKDPSKKTAVFVVYGLDMMEAYPDSIALTLSYLMGTAIRTHGEGRCTALIDETACFSMPALPRLMELGRKRNFRVVSVWQDLFGQAQSLYGKTGMARILASSTLKLFLGSQEPECLKMISEICGVTTVPDVSMNDRSAGAGNTRSRGRGLGHRTRPLVRHDELRGMQLDQLLMMAPGIDPTWLKKLPYWLEPKWKARAGKHPYRFDKE